MKTKNRSIRCGFLTLLACALFIGTNAQPDREKAIAEIKQFPPFVELLEKDSLLRKKQGYIIKHKDGEFFIDGKKQPPTIYNKYRSFLDKHKYFDIRQSDKECYIDIDDKD
jgi:hypothetical protein